MHATRHYLIVLIGLLLLGIFDSPGHALEVAAAIAFCVGLHRLTRVVTLLDRDRLLSRTAPLILAVIITSMVVAAVAAAILFLWSGWIAGTGFVVLFVLFFVAKEDESAASRRKALGVRADLCELIGERDAGTITESQLAARATKILRQTLPRDAYILETVSQALISPDGLTSAQHRRLLELLLRHLEETEKYSIPSRLHRSVLAGLGR